MEFGGLTDVETRGVSGLEGELVCSFMTLTDQHSWKGIWWDCVWMASGRSGFDIVVVNWCPFIQSEGSDGFLQCKSHNTQYIAVGRLSSWICNQHGNSILAPAALKVSTQSLLFYC